MTGEVSEAESKVAITGAGGFLGFHLRGALREFGVEAHAIPLGERFDLDQAVAAVDGASRVIHVAGVNRGSDEQIAACNAAFADQLATALNSAECAPERIVYANSVQAGNGTVYGSAKRAAGHRLGEIADRLGVDFADVELPNLFGEYGSPFYNSVVATFAHLVAVGEQPQIMQDRELTLLHAQDAADLLLGHTSLETMGELVHCETVIGLKDLLENYATVYRAGEMPDLSTRFRRDLFNTYRSYTFPGQGPVSIARHADPRGSFFEVVRSHGGTGQTSFSTTVPGIVRGDHFHRRKVERFTVLSGTAEINLRKLFSKEVHTFTVSGDDPVSVDMPTFYAHNIRNIGQDTLYTAFWTNDIFDPAFPDTTLEKV